MLETLFPGEADRTPNLGNGGDPDAEGKPAERIAIIIQVEEMEETCFIATPFAPEYEKLSDLIGQAVNEFHLQIIRTDRIPRGTHFALDIMRRIRAARVVVAICSPEEEVLVRSASAPDSRDGRPPTRIFNPNVLYEAGLAHALGKPTLILSSDPSELPADLTGTHALEYSPKSLEDRQYAKSMVLQIRDAVRRLVNNNQGWEGISVASAGQMMLLDDDFVQDFRKIRDFGRELKRALQDLSSNHLDVLLREVSKISSKDLSQIFELNKIWEKYEEAYRQSSRELFSTTHDRWRRVEDSFNRLPRRADESARDKIATCRGFYDEIKHSLSDYPSLHRDLARMMNEFLESLDSPERVFSKLRILSSVIVGSIFKTDGLINNLIMVV